MCGIGGVVAINKEKPFSKRCQKELIELMKLLQTRGEDAWGVFLKHVNEKHHLNCWRKDLTITGELFKLDGSVDSFFKEKGGVIDTKDLIIALFHTRAATSGDSKKIENNHPFSTKNFILAHNGGITNHTQLKTSNKLEYDAETDSAVIVALIQKYYDEGKDVVEAIKSTCEKLQGGYACWLYHKDTDDIYLFRKTNPISATKLPKRNIIVFASESRMIHEAFDVGYNITDVLTEYEIYRIRGDNIEKVGEIPHESTTVTTPQLTANRRRTYCGYQTVSGIGLDKAMVEMFQLISKLSKSERGVKVSRIYNDIFILTDSERVLDLVLKGTLGATVQYLKDSKGKYYRIGIPINSITDFIDVLTEELLSSKTEKRDEIILNEKDFEESLTYVAEELGFEWEFTTEGYILKKGREFTDHSAELFKRVGLHFSKKGILIVTKGSSSYSCLKRLVSRYISQVSVGGG